MHKIIHLFRDVILTLPGGALVYRYLVAIRASYCRTRDRKTLQTKGRQLLELVHSRLHGKIPYFIDYGTLLGCIREHAFLKHDDDVDFAIMPGVNPADVIAAFDGSDLVYGGCYVYEGVVREIGYTYHKMHVDFFINSLDGEAFLADAYYDIEGCEYGEKETGCYRFIRPKVTAIHTESFCGVDVDIPDNAEDLLSAHYGPNWRHPDPKWAAQDGTGKYRRIQMPGVARYAVGKEESVLICRK